MRLSFLLTALPLLASAAQADIPDLLRQAIERSDDGPIYPFDIERTATFEGEDDEDGETERTGYARVDLAAPELKQITPAHLIDPNKPGSSFRALGGIETALEDGIWCTRFGDNLPPDEDDYEIIAEDDLSITFEFTPEASGDADGPEKKIAKNTRAKVTVSKDDPAVLRFSSALRRTVRLFVVAQLKKIDVDATCARAPDGRTYVEELTSEIVTSGPGAGNQGSRMAITALYDPETGDQVTP